MNAMQKKQLLKKSKQQKTITFTEAELERLKMKWTRESFKMTLYFAIMALKDGNNFGRIKLEGFVSKFISHYKAYENDMVEIDDMKQAIYDETGFIIK